MSFPWEDDWGGVAVESDVPWEDTFKEEPPEPPLVLGQPEAPVAEVDSMRPVMAGEPVDLGPQRQLEPVQAPDAFPRLSPSELGMARAGIGAFERPKTLGEAVGRGLTSSPLSVVPPVEIPPESSFSKAAVLELANVAKSVPEFFTSAAGIATLFGAKIAPRLVSAGFSADMLLAGLKQAKQAYENWDKMTDAEKGVAVVDTTSALLFSGMAGAHAAGVKLKPAAKPEFQGPIATGEVLPMPRPAVPVRMPIQLPDAARVEPPPGVVVNPPPTQPIAPKPVAKAEEVSASEKLKIQKEQSRIVLERLEKEAVKNGWALDAPIKPRVNVKAVQRALKGTDLDIYSLKTGLLDVELQDMGDGTFAIHRRGESAKAPPSARPGEALPATAAEGKAVAGEPLEVTPAPSAISKTKAGEEVAPEPPAPKPAEPAAPTAKEPWEMTLDEWSKSAYAKESFATRKEAETWQKKHDLPGVVEGLRQDGKETWSIRTDVNPHKRAVFSALREGKPVPPEVLKDYPDLTTSPGTAVPKPVELSEPTPAPKPAASAVAVPGEGAPKPSPLPTDAFVGNLKTGQEFGGYEVLGNYRIKSQAGAVAAANPGTRVEGYLNGKWKRGWVVLRDKATATKPTATAVQKVQPTEQPAIAKVKTEVQRVAATDGQRPAKEIKEEYVQRVEDEINALIKENDEAGTTLEKSVATPESEGGARWSYGGTYADITKTKSGYHVATNVESPLHSTTGSRVKLSGTFKTLDEVEWFIKAVGSSGKGSITVDIPGDGITTIVRKGPSLIDVWKGARKLETKSEAKAKPVPSGGESGKVDADEIAATATKLYGDARKAIAGIKRQLASEQELEPGQRDLLERAIQALTDELPEVKRQNRIDELTDIIQRQEQDLETAQKRIDQVRSEMKSKSGTAKQRQFIYEQETLIRNTNLQLPKRKEELNQLRAQQIAEQPAPIPQGPGGMTRRESARPEPLETIEGTGLKHAIDELERVGYNLAGRTKQEVQNMWDSYQRAKDTLAKNPDAGRELIDAMASDPRRRISREEHPVLLRYKVALENAINDAAERTVSGPMEGRAEARAQFDKRRAELQKFLDVLAFSGSEAGREMRWRQALAFEDFSFASQERRLAAAKGRPLTDPEIVALKQQIADLEAKRAAAEKSYQEREQRAAEAAVKKALDELSKNAPPPRYAPRVLEIAENFANYVEKKAAKAREELDALWAKPGVLSGPLNPEVLDRLAIIGVAKITRGAVEFAKWSDAMIRDLGDRVKPYLDEAFKKAQTLFDSELGNVGKKVGHTVATVVRKKLAEQPAADQISAITASIGKKIGKSSNADICVLVRKLARIHVDEALKVGKKLNHKELIDLLHSDILPFASDITRREVMDAFSGYGDYRLLPKDAVSVILRDLKGQSQQIAKLEDMASGRAPQKTGIEHRTPSDIERGQIKQVEEAKRRGGYAITDQDTQLRTAMDAVKTRLQNQITDLETQIQTRQKIVKDRTRLQYDDEANSLKARRDELKAQFDEIFPKEPITEAERLQLWKDRTTRRIAEIQDMLRSGDIEKKPTRPPLELDAEANRLKAQFDEAKDRLQHERDKAEWERLSVFQKAGRGAVDAYDAARLILTTGEFSFILRQAFPIVAAHPIQSARALPAMFKAMRNWRTAREVDLRITEHPDFAAAKKAGLHIVDETASISRQEEITAGRWAHAIPVVAHFNRAARTFLNKIRFDTWLAMRKTMHRFGEPTPEGDALIAKHINEATGRGSLGFAEPAAVALSRLFFAPRYAVSRFQYLTGHSLWAAQGKGTAAARTTIAIEYARELIGMGLFFATLKALFSNSTTQLDPRSTDFLKLVMGNTRLDALAGLSQAAVFSARTALTGVNAARDALGLPLFRPESLTGKGKEVRLHKPRGQKQLFGQEGYVGTVKNFLRSKAHPVPSIYLNLMSGTGFAGKEATVESELGGLAAPITYQDIYTALRTEGLDHKTALSLLALLGSGIQNYSTKK